MELVLENITKSFKKTTILNGISAKFVPGVYGLLGPNGAGKTTLINILANTSKCTTGRVLWNGKDINRCMDTYREELGYLPQDVGLYPQFKAREFLRYIGVLKGLNKNEIEHKIDELAELVNLTGELDKKCGKYSGGMKRRLGVAQALLNDPKIIILDEPTAGLDPMERIRFRNMLSEISKDKIIIVSTHIVSDIDKIANNVMLINKGNILKNISSQELINSMQGYVWEILTDEKDLNYLEKNFRIANVKQEGSCVYLRVVSEKKPTLNAKNISPILEDVYVYYFGQKSQEERLS